MKTLKLWAERALKLIVLILYTPLGVLVLAVAVAHMLWLVMRRKQNLGALTSAVYFGPAKPLFEMDRAVCSWLFADFVKGA